MRIENPLFRIKHILKIEEIYTPLVFGLLTPSLLNFLIQYFNITSTQTPNSLIALILSPYILIPIAGYKLYLFKVNLSKTYRISVSNDLILIQSLNNLDTQIRLKDIRKATVSFKNRIKLQGLENENEIFILSKQEMKKFIELLEGKGILIEYIPYRSF